jgi:uridylate kinase
MILAEQVARSAKEGIQIAVVMGGGNILRGGQFKAKNAAILESTAHYMGMMATVINGLALQDAIELAGHPTRLMTALDMGSVAEPYYRRRAIRHLEKGRIILLAGGTGSPFVTTDTAAAQRSLELGADVLLKATKVDGVYSDDPVTNPNAVLYSELTYEAVREQRLRIMDQESIAKCGEHGMPVMIFNFRTPGTLESALRGERVGTLIANKN